MARNSRALIRSAALGEFARRGYAGARVARIATTAGVNKQLIYYYFGSKRELYRAVLRGCVEVISGDLAEVGTGGVTLDALKSTLRAFFDTMVTRRPEIGRLLLLELTSPASDIGSAEFVQPVVRLVLEGQSTGIFRDDIDPETVGRQSISLALAYIGMQRTTFAGVSDEEWIREAVDLVGRWIVW